MPCGTPFRHIPNGLIPYCSDGGAYPANKLVDVVSAPIFLAKEAGSVGSECGLVLHSYLIRWIGVEIVIKVYPVYVVACYHILYNGTDVLSGFGYTGIQNFNYGVLQI